MSELIPLGDEFFTGMVKDISKDLEFELEKCRIRPSDEIPPPPVCIKLKNKDGSESWFGTLGNVSTIIGKAKSRKTFALTLVVSAALKNDVLFDKISGNLPENQRTVLYFDTEQGSYHVQLAVKRICELAQVENPLNLKVYGLRSKSPDERLQLVEYAIQNTPEIGFVVIDGVKDLITSINDEEQATMITSKLMKWSEEKNIHIVNILHQNKGNEHARGHIGTELQNKSESVFSVTVSSENKEVSIFESEFCRGKEPESFAFKINEQGIPEIVEHETGNKKGFIHEFTEEKLWFLIQESFKNSSENGLRYGEIVLQLKVNYKQCYAPNEIGDNKAKEIITMCKNYGMIHQSGTKKPYTLNKQYQTASV
jgi:hypothetical protein